MAETSRPWPGTTIGDAGPYNVNNWFDVWAALVNSGVDNGNSDLYNLGVIYSVRNRLAPSDGGTSVDVDTGASLIDGLYHENDASVSVDIPAAAAGLDRIDYVVVRKNYQQAITYTPGGGAPTVPPRTARITVIRGTEAVGPATPSLVQDTTRATYWDIPIATIQVDDAGVLTSLTDRREFANSVFGASVIAADNDTVQYPLTIENRVNAGVGATDLGVGIKARLEDGAGTMDDAGNLVFKWDTAGTNSRLIMSVLGAGSIRERAILRGYSTASLDGNARGDGATDLQPYRVLATEVASGALSVICGGGENIASGQYSAVVGGDNNEASGTRAFMGAGSDNVAQGLASVLCGGDSNNIAAAYAIIVGGNSNTASGQYSMVLGGLSNTADGDYSFASGRSADTNSFDGVFIWADSQAAAFTADRANQFKVRAIGGVHFVQNNATAALPVLELEQDDQDQPFIDFDGTLAADQTKNISTVNGDGVVEGPKNFSSTAGWAFGGMIKISINGSDVWFPYYTPDLS